MFTPKTTQLSPKQQIFVDVVCERLTQDILIKSYAAAERMYTKTIGGYDTEQYNIANRTIFTFGLSPLYRNIKMIHRSWSVDLTSTDKTPQTILFELLNASGGNGFYSFKWMLINDISININKLSPNLPEDFSPICMNPNNKYSNTSTTQTIADETAQIIINAITQKLTNAASTPIKPAKQIKPKFGPTNF